MNIDSIATLADKLCNKDITSEKMRSLVREVIDSGGRVTEHQAAVLFRKFSSKTRNADNPIDWVHLATIQNDVRGFTKYIHSDGERIAATDGHRIHVYNTDKYPVGYHDKRMYAQNDVASDFPTIDRFMPINKDCGKMVDISKMDIVSIKIDNKKFETAYVFNDKLGFNKRYVDEALSLFDDVKEVCITDDCKQMYLYHGGCFFTIMAVSLGEEEK